MNHASYDKLLAENVYSIPSSNYTKLFSRKISFPQKLPKY